jgi:hypothetical protein
MCTPSQPSELVLIGKMWPQFLRGLSTNVGEQMVMSSIQSTIHVLSVSSVPGTVSGGYLGGVGILDPAFLPPSDAILAQIHEWRM